MPHIRPLIRRDCTTLEVLHKSSIDPYLSAAHFESLLNNLHIYGYGIEYFSHDTQDPSLCGFIIVKKLLEEAEIIELCVAPAYQRRGWGALLMQTFLEEASADNIKKIFLEVAVDNDNAQKFYAYFGFKPYARRPQYYKRRNGQRVDAYNYMKELPDCRSL